MLSGQEKLINNYNDKIKEFTNPLTGTGFIALRDISKIINENITIKSRVLDFGCGAGRSTRFLRELGYYADGVDINKQMIEAAIKQDTNQQKGKYYLINNYNDLKSLEKYNIIFNLFVLFEFGNETLLHKYLSALLNNLTDNGILISVLNSEYLYTKNWLSCLNDFDQNKNLKSGEIAKIILPAMNNIEIFDYYWSENDYIHFFTSAGFNQIKLYQPLGLETDPYQWKDEKKFPPYTIFVCKKY